jgi:hypothetical protein
VAGDEDGGAGGRVAGIATIPLGIFWVGASRVSPSRAPQPPQNRESGSFWVPQLEQRIPSQA